ncbi:hypothetical protein ABTJ35_19025, partial [Acinetobacter baumannii]
LRNPSGSPKVLPPGAIGGFEMSEEKVTVVERGGGGTAIAIVVGIVAILAILYVLFGTNLLSGKTEKIDADIKVEAPAK